MAEGILDRIIDHKRRELELLAKQPLPIAPGLRSFDLRRIASGRLSLIAEIKHSSPSAGELSRALSVARRAQCYAEAGAAMISVLCDQAFFGGDYAHLTQARVATNLPLLCKEFVLDEIQLRAARAFGADAVLLIVRCLSQPELERLMALAQRLGLASLVEVHDEREARVALECQARWIGVNARDLNTLEMDVAGAQQVLDRLPQDVCRTHLSGLATPADVTRIAERGLDAALVGEVLMRQDDPAPLLGAMVRAAAG